MTPSAARWLLAACLFWGSAAGPVELPRSGKKEAKHVSLLQQAFDLSSSVSMLQGRTRVSSYTIPLPISWLHVPKCGTSFLNTLMHLPGVCPGLPLDLHVNTSTLGRDLIGNFNERYGETCTGLYHHHDTRAIGGHLGVGDPKSPRYGPQKGHLVVMLREPRERLMSAYDHMVREFNGEEVGIAPMDDKRHAWGGWPNGTELPTLPRFARYARGCAVRLLTRSGFSCGGADGPPTREEVLLAKTRLANDFAFVGLTSQWALSMCLFDAVFGTGCQRWQFENNRPNPRRRTYNLSELEGVEDPYDTELYKEAKQLFEEQKQRHGVSEESCRPCYLAAGLRVAVNGSLLDVA